MVLNFRLQREPLRNGLILLFLAFLVSACGGANTAGSSTTPTAIQESGSAATATATQGTSSAATSTTSQGITGTFHEYALPLSQFAPLTITAGPDGNLWFTEIIQNGSVQGSKIGRASCRERV